MVKNCENNVFRVIFVFSKNVQGWGHFLGTVRLQQTNFFFCVGLTHVSNKQLYNYQGVSNRLLLYILERPMTVTLIILQYIQWNPATTPPDTTRIPLLRQHSESNGFFPSLSMFEKLRYYANSLQRQFSPITNLFFLLKLTPLQRQFVFGRERSRKEKTKRHTLYITIETLIQEQVEQKSRVAKCMKFNIRASRNRRAGWHH